KAQVAGRKRDPSLAAGDGSIPFRGRLRHQSVLGSSPMASPFIYEEPVTLDALIDRGEELARLLDRVSEARNSRLQAPRRFGKTSLLRAVLARSENDGTVAIEVNFLGCVS